MVASTCTAPISSLSFSPDRYASGHAFYTRAMTMPEPLGPFRAGPGGLPPYLAGRESVQAACRAFVAEVRRGRPPPREIVLYGPRGNGKTALLVWLEKEAATDSGLDVIRLTPAAIRTETMLVERLLPVSWRQRLAPERISVYGITWRPGEGRTPPLDVALAARAERKPLVLVLDEAHTLDAGVGGALLNASQQVGRELPFLLVLAGTPDLQSRLGAMDVTFWNRAERHPIGRLDLPAATAALQKPLEREGIGIDQDAVAHMSRDSHGYPYFVQLWGEAVWRQVRTPPPEAQRRITRAVADAAQTAFDQRRNGYYLERYDELMERDLLSVARAVADAFEARSLLDDAQLTAAIRRGLGEACRPERIAQTRTALRHLGYVWRPDTEPKWEAGIPSLMDYVQAYVSI